MSRIELTARDIREIAGVCVAPAAAQSLDQLGRHELEDVLGVAVELRQALDAIIAGQVHGGRCQTSAARRD